MLSIGNTLGSAGASLSLETRVAVGAGVFAVGAAQSSARVLETPASQTPGQRLPAYNSFEFTYRPDFGKVILLQQNVETGQEVTQVPTEYHLRQYAATQRQQRVQQLQKLYQSASGESQSQAPVVAAVAKEAAPPSGPSAPAASPSAAPAVAASPVVAAPTAQVDIKI